MKPHTLLLGSALAGAALAQTSAGDDDVVTVTSFVDPTDCPTNPGANSAGAGAATQTTTVPLEQCSEEPCPNESAGPMTTYETVYSTWCPEGMTAATYTVTEPCPGPSGAPRPSDHIPQGFTVVTESCPVCASPTAGVITKPAPAPAPAPAMPTGPAPGPASGPAPAPAPANGGGEAPTPAPAPAQGGGAPAPAPEHGNAAPAPASGNAAPAPASGNAAPAPAAAGGNSSVGCTGDSCKPKGNMNYSNAAAASAVISCGTGLLSIAALLTLL